MYELLLAAIIVFVASVLQSAIGFGFAIVATPFLLLVYNSRDVIQLSIILSFFVAVFLIKKIWHQIDHAMLKRLIYGSILGVPLGLLFFVYVSLDILKVTISIIVLIIASFMLIKWYYNYHKVSSHKQQDDRTDASGTQLLAGFLSGMLTTSVGMPGVPLAVYFSAKNVKKEVVRSTTLAFFIFVYIISMISQLITVKVGYNVISISLTLIPAVAVGVIGGNYLFNRINQKIFHLFVNGILIFTGVYMLVTT
ncbi:MAG: sulfite exporter TauE/SafE family protein [Firmicutes bacterium]|nr:sulfite exporter TauE/SafE family protein [Bacillota bacterium]